MVPEGSNLVLAFQLIRNGCLTFHVPADHRDVHLRLPDEVLPYLR